MIRAVINKSEVDSIIDEFKLIKQSIGSDKLNKYRAEKYRKFTIEYVSKDDLGLEPLSDATKKIAGDHSPLWDRGELVKAMEVKRINSGGAAAGYFGEDPFIKDQKNEQYTTTEWAILMHVGGRGGGGKFYKIPLTGDKGKRVRNYLKSFDIYPKAGTEALIVPVRPYMLQSLHRYEDEGWDDMAIKEFFSKTIDASSEEQ